MVQIVPGQFQKISFKYILHSEVFHIRKVQPHLLGDWNLEWPVITKNF